MEQTTGEIRMMPLRGVLSREIRALALGETLKIRYKYCPINRIRVVMCQMKDEPQKYAVDYSDDAYAMITRIV